MRFELDMERFNALPIDQRRVALGALKELDENAKANPLWLFDPLAPGGSDTPHWKQHRWMAAHHLEGRRIKHRLFIGGNRAGKTTSGIVADIIDMCDEDAIPPHLRQYKSWHQPLKAFLVAKNTRTAETITLPKLRQWMPKSQLVGGRWDRAFSKELGRLSLRNGSWLQVMTQSMEVEAFAGADLHRVHFDEEPLYDHGRELYNECLARLIDHNGDMVITMTPQLGMTWLYDDIYGPWEEALKGEQEGVVDLGARGLIYGAVVDMEDNPTLNEEGKTTAMAGFGSDEQRQARGSGRFVSFAGKIFDDFSKQQHVVPESVALSHARGAGVVRKYVGLDPGFRHMAGAVWIAMDQDGVWVFGEVGEQKTVIAEVARAVLMKTAETGVTPDAYIADPAIERTDHQTGITDRAAYAKAGVKTALGNNSWEPGVNRIKSLLNPGRDGEGNALPPRLFISAGCPELIKQFGRYRWVTPKRTEHDARAAPVKKDDHLLDALRYAIMALPDFVVPKPPDTRSYKEIGAQRDSARALARKPQVPTDLGSGFFG